MKLLIGPAAENEMFFNRPILQSQFLRKMDQSKHVSIAAARRIGKTSFMKSLATQSIGKYDFHYLITESINNSNKFFEKLYKVLLNQISNDKKVKEYIEDLFKKLDIKKIGITEIEFGKTDINFFEELSLLIQKLKTPKTIVLLIDEYSQTLQNIIEEQGEKTAKLFLHQCRELRVMQTAETKVHFVFAGSIGLENLVANLNESKTIADLANFEVPPFTETETKEFFIQILDTDPYHFPREEQEYFIQKLRWLLPYYIQVIMGEIETILKNEKKNIIERDLIDRAFDIAILNRTYFSHWKQRLKSIFKGKEHQSAIELLDFTSTQAILTRYDIQDIYKKFEVDPSNEIINILIHDGYLSKIEAHKYRFNSPLLENWWKQNLDN